MTRDLTRDECQKMAETAAQPNNALYSRTTAELAAAIYAIGGPRK